MGNVVIVFKLSTKGKQTRIHVHMRALYGCCLMFSYNGIFILAPLQTRTCRPWPSTGDLDLLDLTLAQHLQHKLEIHTTV